MLDTKSTLLFVLSLAIKPIQGHGGVYNYTIDGVEYAGHYPWLPEEGQISVQRRWFPDPIFTEQHPYLACNRGNPLATSLPTLHAPARAGTNIIARYVPPQCPKSGTYSPPTQPAVPEYQDPSPMKCTGPEFPWSHNQGPLFVWGHEYLMKLILMLAIRLQQVYMADCQGPCNEWDGHGKRWFKIWEAGYNATGVTGSKDPGQMKSITEPDRWWHATITQSGINVTIPRTLKPGNYLIRHEIINLRSNPAQLYPECAQLEVIGDGGSVPSEEYLVEFPGAYKATDPGLAISGKLYEQVGLSTFNYTMPGPKVWVPEE
ncbi:lytic polysaccharide monooxygenase [Annulohypoxylon moriforme]|nr:lytic polysaccharide monooxygenase [Annulohypoxylon moriforme]